MEQFLARMERLLAGFEQLFEVFTGLMQQEQSQDEPQKLPYQYGHMTAYWVKKVDDGNCCLQELIDSKNYHESSRAQRGYPIDKSYHGPIAEAIEVLQARPANVAEVVAP